MAKEYKLVELTDEEKEGLSFIDEAILACSKCIACRNDDLCCEMNECGDTGYFIEVTE